ncbi:MAG: hypothetical protein BM556_01300 [Bacteriovorax sp. MedPE-SWde]|nr:MAG: hypothetical protein BM556_01300 [Bacteriovorax sp. MedPE-SWde]
MSNVKKMTKTDILKVQNKWADAVIHIGRAFKQKEDYVEVAHLLIAELYAYEFSNVLFKPTKASEEQFRNTKEKALSYFIASNGKCDEDKGFALQPWKEIRFENTDMILGAETSQCMGNYYFTDYNGEEIKVEYTFGYIRDEDGLLKINIHHSSLPFFQETPVIEASVESNPSVTM